MAQIRIARTVLAHALGLALLGVAGGLQAQEAPQGQASAQQQPGAAQGQAAPPGGVCRRPRTAPEPAG